MIWCPFATTRPALRTNFPPSSKIFLENCLLRSLPSPWYPIQTHNKKEREKIPLLPLFLFHPQLCKSQDQPQIPFVLALFHQSFNLLSVCLHFIFSIFFFFIVGFVDCTKYRILL
nr:MAG TPA: hypothetical protein [Caudoviricetes sp.]